MTVEEWPACYIVKDANGFDVAFVNYEEEHDRRAAAKLMTQDEASGLRYDATNPRSEANRSTQDHFERVLLFATVRSQVKNSSIANGSGRIFGASSWSVNTALEFFRAH